MRNLRLIGLTLAISGIATCWALAQSPQNPPPLPVSSSEVIPMSFVQEQDAKPPVLPDKDLNLPVLPDQEKKQGVVAPSKLEDPTKPGPRLQDAINAGKTTTTGESYMPTLGLRGRIIVKDQNAQAIIEMDGSLYVVGKGSMLMSRGNISLRIEDVTSQEVRIEVASSKNVIILR